MLKTELLKVCVLIKYILHGDIKFILYGQVRERSDLVWFK